MSHINSTARRAVVGLGAVTGGAFAAAFIGIGTAGAVVGDEFPSCCSGEEGYSILFGGDGADSGVTTAQAADNLSLDTQLYDQNPGDAASFATSAATFEAGNDHAIEDIVNALDPSAFSTQVTDGITGTLAGGGYLVPEDSLGYLATGLDYFLLTPTGLDYLLSPVAELLLGSPPF